MSASRLRGRRPWPVRRRAGALGAGALTLAVLAAGCSSTRSTGGAGPTATATASGTSRTVTVHLDVLHQGQATLALVPVKIGGKGPYAFVLDTGAAISGINADLAAKLGLHKTGKTSEVSGVASTTRVSLVAVTHWSVGGAPLRPSSIGALNFPRQSGGASKTSRISGLLGSDQLSRFGSITVDYARQQLRFTPGAG